MKKNFNLLKRKKYQKGTTKMKFKK